MRFVLKFLRKTYIRVTWPRWPWTNF